MTLVADTGSLAVLADGMDIQAINGVFVQGFDPTFDHPLNWGLDAVTPADVLGIGNSLSGAFLNVAATNLGGFPGFAPPPPAPPAPATQPLVLNGLAAWNTLAGLLGAAGFNIQWPGTSGNLSITDNRTARLYVTVDLNEWIEFRRRDVVHLVLNNWNGYMPLGQSTVWLRSDAWIQHGRGKTARVYLQGRIADRMQRQLMEGETIPPQEFVNKILDADAESAYSSVFGPC